jgi:ribosomal-protein-alanine N-acetyltransferase
VKITRLVSVDDAAAIAALQRASREFLAPWEPVRPEEFFTAEGQLADIEGALARHADDRCLPHVILDDDGQVAGRITLNDIVRGPFLSCHLGYWVNPASGGRGLATAAIGEIKRIAFEELGLHRIQAATLVHNARSQRVLAKNGFVPIGMAPAYLRIAGEWQDHNLYQVLAEGGSPGEPPS